MTYPKTKYEVTEAILYAMPKSEWHEMPIGKVVFRWWVSGRGGYSLRLTDEGAKAFDTVNVEYYEFPLGPLKEFNGANNLSRQLSKKIQCPYWLGLNNKDKTKATTCIRIYDNKVALIMSLYGNLRDYLDSFENRMNP